MTLQAPERVDPGTLVQVRLKDTLILGEVRYCISAGAEFHIGLEIGSSFPRS
jgi:hypothetical protein